MGDRLPALLEVTQQTVRNCSKEEPKYGVDNVSRVSRRRLSPEQEQMVLNFIASQPGMIQEDVVAFVSRTFSVSITRFTASRILRRNNITRKRATRLNNRSVACNSSTV